MFGAKRPKISGARKSVDICHERSKGNAVCGAVFHAAGLRDENVRYTLAFCLVSPRSSIRVGTFLDPPVETDAQKHEILGDVIGRGAADCIPA